MPSINQRKESNEFGELKTIFDIGKSVYDMKNSGGTASAPSAASTAMGRKAAGMTAQQPTKIGGQ